MKNDGEEINDMTQVSNIFVYTLLRICKDEIIESSLIDAKEKEIMRKQSEFLNEIQKRSTNHCLWLVFLNTSFRFK